MKQSAIAAAILVLSSGLVWAQNAANQSNQGQPQTPPAAQSGEPNQKPQKPEPVTGKTGNQATHIPDTTSGSAGQETPGVQTNNGAQQQPGKHQELKGSNAPQPNPQQQPGAPPNWEQVGQSPQAGDIDAAAASRAEIGGEGGHTLGVDTTPRYDQNANAQKSGTAQNAAKSKSKNKGKHPGKAGKQSPARQTPPQR